MAASAELLLASAVAAPAIAQPSERAYAMEAGLLWHVLQRFCPAMQSATPFTSGSPFLVIRSRRSAIPIFNVSWECLNY